MRNAFIINQEQYDSVKNITTHPFRKDLIIEDRICIYWNRLRNSVLYFKEESVCPNIEKKIHKFNFLKFLKEFGGYDRLNIDLTGYCVEVENEEESRELQEYAFSEEFEWYSGSKEVKSFNIKFLYFFEDKHMEYSTCPLPDSRIPFEIKFRDLLTLHQDKEEVLVKYDKPGKIIIDGKELELEKFVTEDNLINLGSKDMELEEELIEKIILNSEIEEKLFEISKFKKKLEYEIIELKLKIKERDKPKVGDLCVFSDDDFFTKVVSKFFEINTSDFPYTTSRGLAYKRCVKITDENIINFFKNLK